MIFYLTPLLAAVIIDKNAVRKLKAALRRKVFGAPNEIKSKVILNMAEHNERPTAEGTANIARKIKDRGTKQQVLAPK